MSSRTRRTVLHLSHLPVFLVLLTTGALGLPSSRVPDGLDRIMALTEGARTSAMTCSGGLSVAEHAVADAASSLPPQASSLVEYQRGPDMGGGVGGLLYSLRSSSIGPQAPNVRFNLSNGRGDVVAQSDTTGALTWTASYEAYGKRPVETGSNADRQRANTKEEDPTGLLNEGFRYRDLETGVWLSRDPAGFVDGPNLYAYVRQNPWTSFDPDGLESERIKQLRKEWDDTPVSMTRLWRGLHYAGAALNPFDGDSVIREKGRELSTNVEQAAVDIDSAPIPRPFKSMAKFSLGFGNAGAHLDPAMLTSSLTETAVQVKEKGVAEVAANMVVNIAHDAQHNPEKLVGELTVGIATGSAFKRALAPTVAEGSTTVTRWQVPPSETLVPGKSWVMTGGKNWWNWALSGKMNPLRPQFHVPFKNGVTFEVPKADLARPPGIEAIKMKQRIYTGSSGTPPVPTPP